MLPRWFNSSLLKNMLGLKTTLRDELRIFVRPQHLLMLRMKRWPGNAIVDRHIIELGTAVHIPPVTTEILSPLANKAVFQDLWRPAISALGTALSDPRWQNAIPNVVLSSHFVRYAIVPWNADLANSAERHAYLRHCFTLAYGEVARKWDLRISPSGFGRPALASGISTALLEAIRVELEQAGMRTGNIHPHLMLAANETREHLGKEKAAQSLWFVCLEPGRLCLSLVENGQWRSLKSIATEDDISEQLKALIQRESIMAGLDAGNWPVVIHSSEPENPEYAGSGHIKLPGHVVSVVPVTPVFAPMTGTYKLAT